MHQTSPVSIGLETKVAKRGKLRNVASSGTVRNSIQSSSSNLTPNLSTAITQTHPFSPHHRPQCPPENPGKTPLLPTTHLPPHSHK